MELVIKSPHNIAFLPQPPNPTIGAGEILVEVHRISLCGSDYRLYDGTYGGPKNYPIRFGHEWAGLVIDASHGSKFATGDRVTGDCSKWCGSCDMCSSDKNLCRCIEKFGITVDGFSARQLVVHEKYLYVDRLDLDFELLALVELFAVARRGIRLAESNRRLSGPVLVIGAGAVGLATYLILTRELGIKEVLLTDTDPEKSQRVSERIKGCDFDYVLRSGSWDGQFTYSEISAAARYQTVFECSGGIGALNCALFACCMGGQVICMGLANHTALRTDLMVTKRLALQGSIGGTGEFPAAMSFIAQERDAATRLITHRFASADATNAFDTTIGAHDRIKTQLVF